MIDSIIIVPRINLEGDDEERAQHSCWYMHACMYCTCQEYGRLYVSTYMDMSQKKEEEEGREVRQYEEELFLRENEDQRLN